MESSILEYEDKTTVKIPAKLIFYYGFKWFSSVMVNIPPCHGA